MTEPRHTYPPLYPPGTHWAFDEAWAILDRVRPGAIDQETRAFLAGCIAGTLRRVVAGGARPAPEDPTPTALCRWCGQPLAHHPQEGPPWRCHLNDGPLLPLEANP